MKFFDFDRSLKNVDDHSVPIVSFQSQTNDREIKVVIVKIGIWVKEKNQMWLLDQEYGLGGLAWLFYSLVVSLLVSFLPEVDIDPTGSKSKPTGSNLKFQLFHQGLFKDAIIHCKFLARI